MDMIWYHSYSKSPWIWWDFEADLMSLEWSFFRWISWGYHLVGGWTLPLWKIWLRHLGLWHSQLNGKTIRSCSKPPTNHLWYGFDIASTRTLNGYFFASHCDEKEIYQMPSMGIPTRGSFITPLRIEAANKKGDSRVGFINFNNSWLIYIYIELVYIMGTSWYYINNQDILNRVGFINCNKWYITCTKTAL